VDKTHDSFVIFLLSIVCPLRITACDSES